MPSTTPDAKNRAPTIFYAPTNDFDTFALRPSGPGLDLACEQVYNGSQWLIYRQDSMSPINIPFMPIPGGRVTLDHRGGWLAAPLTMTVAPFALAQYPVTNAQYQAFIDAPDGFAHLDWWAFSAAARDWRLEHDAPLAAPFGGADAPRTHVTWYEAVAFCGWFSQHSGQPVRLPTEAEWQHAAQGDDARPYPWGAEWDAHRCHNCVAHKVIGPASVQTYAGLGDSPYGVIDMAGNVWEWTATLWATGADTPQGDGVRVLRGGSWFDDVVGAFRVTTRSSWNPDLPSDTRGFRLAR